MPHTSDIHSCHRHQDHTHTTDIRHTLIPQTSGTHSYHIHQVHTHPSSKWRVRYTTPSLPLPLLHTPLTQLFWHKYEIFMGSVDGRTLQLPLATIFIPSAISCKCVKKQAKNLYLKRQYTKYLRPNCWYYSALSNTISINLFLFNLLE